MEGPPSPIDVVKRHAIIYPNLGRLRRIYYPAKATLVNRGHDIMVNWSEGAGGVDIEGKRFTLHQSHWHTPAEHTVLWKKVKAVELAGCDWVHVDVLDGHFVPNITIGPLVIAAL